MEFYKDTWNIRRDTAEFVQYFSNNGPSLWNNCNQTYTGCSACTMSERCVLKRSMEYEERESGEGTLFFK